MDELLEGPLDTLAFRRRLLKQHEEHVLLGVDHHMAAAGAIPDKKASLNFRIVRRVMTSNSLFTRSPLQLPVELQPGAALHQAKKSARSPANATGTGAVPTGTSSFGSRINSRAAANQD